MAPVNESERSAGDKRSVRGGRSSQQIFLSCDTNTRQQTDLAGQRYGGTSLTNQFLQTNLQDVNPTITCNCQSELSCVSKALHDQRAIEFAYLQGKETGQDAIGAGWERAAAMIRTKGRRCRRTCPQVARGFAAKAAADITAPLPPPNPLGPNQPSEKSCAARIYSGGTLRKGAPHRNWKCPLKMQIVIRRNEGMTFAALARNVLASQVGRIAGWRVAREEKPARNVRRWKAERAARGKGEGAYAAIQPSSVPVADTSGSTTVVEEVAETARVHRRWRAEFDTAPRLSDKFEKDGTVCDVKKGRCRSHTFSWEVEVRKASWASQVSVNQMYMAFQSNKSGRPIFPRLLRARNEEDPDRHIRIAFFQQDGVPLHYHRDVWLLLDERYVERSIGRRGCFEYPPRSPSLLLDSYLWGTLNNNACVRHEAANTGCHWRSDCDRLSIQSHGNRTYCLSFCYTALQTMLLMSDQQRYDHSVVIMISNHLRGSNMSPVYHCDEATLNVPERYIGTRVWLPRAMLQLISRTCCTYLRVCVCVYIYFLLAARLSEAEARGMLECGQKGCGGTEREGGGKTSMENDVWYAVGVGLGRRLGKEGPRRLIIIIAGRTADPRGHSAEEGPPHDDDAGRLAPGWRGASEVWTSLPARQGVDDLPPASSHTSACRFTIIIRVDFFDIHHYAINSVICRVLQDCWDSAWSIAEEDHLIRDSIIAASPSHAGSDRATPKGRLASLYVVPALQNVRGTNATSCTLKSTSTTGFIERFFYSYNRHSGKWTNGGEAAKTTTRLRRGLILKTNNFICGRSYREGQGARALKGLSVGRARPDRMTAEGVRGEENSTLELLCPQLLRRGTNPFTPARRRGEKRLLQRFPRRLVGASPRVTSPPPPPPTHTHKERSRTSFIIHSFTVTSHFSEALLKFYFHDIPPASSKQSLTNPTGLQQKAAHRNSLRREESSSSPGTTDQNFSSGAVRAGNVGVYSGCSCVLRRLHSTCSASTPYLTYFGSAIRTTEWSVPRLNSSIAQKAATSLLTVQTNANAQLPPVSQDSPYLRKNFKSPSSAANSVFLRDPHCRRQAIHFGSDCTTDDRFLSRTYGHSIQRRINTDVSRQKMTVIIAAVHVPQNLDRFQVAIGKWAATENRFVHDSPRHKRLGLRPKLLVNTIKQSLRPLLLEKPDLLLTVKIVVNTVSFYKYDLVPTLRLGGPGSIPGVVAHRFSHVGIVPDDAAGRQVISEISHFPRPFIPALLHAHLASPTSALKISISVKVVPHKSSSSENAFQDRGTVRGAESQGRKGGSAWQGDKRKRSQDGATGENESAAVWELPDINPKRRRDHDVPRREWAMIVRGEGEAGSAVPTVCPSSDLDPNVHEGRGTPCPLPLPQSLTITMDKRGRKNALTSGSPLLTIRNQYLEDGYRPRHITSSGRGSKTPSHSSTADVVVRWLQSTRGGEKELLNNPRSCYAARGRAELGRASLEGRWITHLRPLKGGCLRRWRDWEGVAARLFEQLGGGTRSCLREKRTRRMHARKKTKHPSHRTRNSRDLFLPLSARPSALPTYTRKKGYRKKTNIVNKLLVPVGQFECAYNIIPSLGELYGPDANFY
ncbi:hypothetical protein PR048_017056 [Dryococelus australis]|uniref:Uncharacterized protein n=1 Tax=Dryococelus australis TaxID=614101 RepID=A0ABQ9H8J3_9NEOP|nr:hypothetical protein PR048_017056 [Dryococelus australis]